MAKKLNVDLTFSANTTQAKQAIQELQQSLAKVSAIKVGNSQQLKEASEAAKMLSYHLNQAYNATTGNIDLRALNNSLQKSQTNVIELSNKFLQAGESGQQAFIHLAQAISTADYPMFKLNSKLSEMLTTLKNTARWQLSSSLLHGFMGAVSSAYGYAQDLNESLNNIRVVTGQNADDMAKFAEQANKAAKALSTTTTDYTNASLIYYQQGLSDEEVLKRTDITVKMANVAGTSAELASNQLTAVWNNFAKTGENLEYYADVMTALGAATATSTDEIAGGLEKFAAVANTIGLSYEYAASALATITSNTRESEEVVGTALKTIFARIQGLQLGETLEDGTTLNKYSEALAKVGISIFDSTGELKKMDNILDEMANKWQILSKDQQVALAQTVAGVRQYNQLVALMDNWNVGDSDSMVSNLETAYNAAGALQEQADIWAESWEAASNRVTTAAQGIYDSLLDDDLFIDFNNIIADLLSGIENVIDGIGGLKGVIAGVGSFTLALLSNKIQPMLRSMFLNIGALFQSAQQQAFTMVDAITKKANQELGKTSYSTGQKQELINSRDLSIARAQLTVVSKNLTDQERQMYEFDLSLIAKEQEKAQAIANTITQLQEEANTLKNNTNATNQATEANKLFVDRLKELQQMRENALDEAVTTDDVDASNRSLQQFDNMNDAILVLEDTHKQLNAAVNQTTSALMQEYENWHKTEEAIKSGNMDLQEYTINTNHIMDPLISTFASLRERVIDAEGDTIQYTSSIELLTKSLPPSVTQLKNFQKAYISAMDADNAEDMAIALEQMIAQLKLVKISAKDLPNIGKSLNPKEFEQFIQLLKRTQDEEKKLIQIQSQLNNMLNNFNPVHMVSGIERLTAAAGMLGQVAMMGTSISSMVNAWSSADISFGEKLATTFTTLSMLIPGLLSTWKSLNTVLQGSTIQMKAYEKSLEASIKAEATKNGITLTTTQIEQKKAGVMAVISTLNQKTITEESALAAAEYLLGDAFDDSAKEILKNQIAKKGLSAETFKAAIAEIALEKGLDAEAIAALQAKLSTDALNMSLKSLLGPIGIVIGVITALAGVLTFVTKKQEEKIAADKEARKQAAEAAIENAKIITEEKKAIEELYIEYVNLQSKLDGSVESKEALKEKTQELCNALGVEWNALDKLQDKYDDVNEAMLLARKETLLTYLQDLKQDIDVAGEQLEDIVDQVPALSEYDFGVSTGTRYGEEKQDEWWNASQWFDGNDTYQPLEQYKHNYLYGGGSTNTGIDNTNIRNLFYDWMYDNYSNILEEDEIDENDLAWGNRGQRALYFNEGVEQSKIISALKEFSSYLIANKDSLNINENAAAYEWFKGFNKDENVTEQLANLEGMNQDLLKGIQELAQIEANLSSKDISKIKSEDDFNSYKESWVQNFKNALTERKIDISAFSEEDFSRMAEEYLAQYSNIGSIINMRDVISSINEKTNIPKDELEKLAKEYSDFMTLIPSIDFNKVKSIEELKNILSILQTTADATKIQTQIDIVKNAKDNLKEGMSVSDYNTFKDESNIAWGEMDAALGKEIISYGEFLQMTYNQQVAYLENLEQAYLSRQSSTINSALSSNQILLESYQSELEALNSQESLSEEDLIRVEELKILIESLTTSLPELQGVISTVNGTILSTVTSLGELYAKMAQISIDDGAVNFDQYASALISLGEQYDNCKENVNRFKEALDSGNGAQIESSRALLEGAIRAGELAEQYDLNAEELERYADQLQLQNKNSNLSHKALVELAKDQKRYDRAVKSASENMETWNDAIKTFQKGGMISSETLEDMAQCYGDLIDVDGSELSTEFLTSTQNLEDMQKALKGDEEAYRRLQEEAGKDILKRVGLDTSQYETDLQTLNTLAATVEGEGLADIEAGATIDNSDYLAKLTEMVNKAGMTAQQATDYLSSMGVDAEVVEEETTTPEPQTYMGAVPEITSVPAWGTNPVTGEPQKYTFPSVEYIENPMTTVGEKTSVATSLKVTSANKSSGGDIKHIVNQNTGGVAKKTGGGSKPKKTSEARQKKSDTVERYKPVNDKLDDMADALDDASKAADRMWGTARIKQMEKVNSILEDEIELIKEKKSEAEAYLKIDRDDLNASAADLGISFAYKDGNIANYDSQMTKLYNKREALLDSFGEEIDETEQETLDIFDTKLDKLKEAIAQYDETRELIEDLDNEEWDKRNEIQDNNFEKLNYALEIEVQFNEDDLAIIEYHMSKMEDDFYLMAEAYAKLSESSVVYEDNLKLQKQYVADLEEAYKNGEISQAAYIEGLQNAKDATMENAQALIELDHQMMEYYGNTLDAANEELSKYTDKMEHLTSVLDHYSNIIDLLGKKQDYATMGSILEGQAHTIHNELEVAQRTYEMYDAEAKHWKEQMDSAIEGSDAWEVYKANWEAAQTAANDAQDSMLAKTEEWVEAMKAVVENNMAELNQTLEQSLTGGSDFDTMLETMERASSLQEEYLTTTNKIYETNKLMRTAQQEIDKTQNTVAKRRLTQFIKETEQLQHQNKLSNYELEIQQAKYDLLLAEIALEEAQSAKSTVRLQRDTEGNFGYVYTADQDKVAQAQQDLEDAQNSLYNIGLEGANDYSQKYAETMQEMYDTMAELQQAYLDGEIATQEEYDAKMLAAKEYYFNKLKDYSNLYQVALTTDSRVVNDAWSSDFNDMIYKTGELQSSVNTYVSESATILQGWSATIKQALSETGLDNIDEQVKDVTTASDELKESLIGTDGKGGVVKAIQDEIIEVNNLSGAYAAVRTTIQGLIADHEKLMSTINDTQKTEEEAAKNTEANVNNATDNTSTDQQTQDNNSSNEESAAAQHDERTKAGVALAIIRNATAAGWGNGSTRKKNLEAKGFSYNEIQGLVNTYFGNSQALIAENGINWPSDYSKYIFSRFNTGGYTGSWGSYGKLGILDEKELVLNQGDTANFLASMEVLERILQVIDLHSMNAQLGGLLSSPSYGGNNNETTIEQNVHIEASFPGVSDRNEIEEAFNNLVNQASQYANRK